MWIYMLKVDALHSQSGIEATGPLACPIRLSSHTKFKHVKTSLPYNMPSVAQLNLLWKDNF